MLAIVSPYFQAPSVTFIREHVRSLAPGATILLCENGEGTEQFGCPVLADIATWPPVRSLRERIALAALVRWRGYVDPSLRRADSDRVKAFLSRHRADVVLAEFGDTGCLVARAVEALGLPLYVHFHGYDASMLLNDARQVRWYRAMFGRSAGVIAPSRVLADKLAAIGCPPAKLHIIPYGVDPTRFMPARGIAGHLVAVGRLVAKKAPYLTIAAFARIANRFPQARLNMVGAGGLAARCETMISECGLRDRVVLHGAQPPAFVARLMQESAIFVQHSLTTEDGDTEGLPVAILEAMASGLPVVASRHSGIPEAVQHGVTGLLFDEGDVDGMARAMAQLLEDPAQAAAMGAAGRRRVLAEFTAVHSRNRLRAVMGLPPLSNGQNAVEAQAAHG